MKTSVAKVLSVFMLLSRIKNRVLNQLVFWSTGQKISIDWSGIKIINPGTIQIGDSFYAGRGLWLESVNGKGDLQIGSNVHLSENVHIGCALKITIGHGVLTGSKVLISDHAHGAFLETGPQDLLMNPSDRPIVSKGPVFIEDRVWLGDGVCVLPNVRIGKGAIVGANAVVLSNIPAGTIWAGVPAKQVWPAVN